MSFRNGFLSAAACLCILLGVVAAEELHQQEGQSASCTRFAAAQQQGGQTASATPAKPPAHKGPDDNMMAAHGVLMAVSFIAILPISVMFAAIRDRLWGPRVWFQTHRALNLTAAVLILVGLILGAIGWGAISHVRRILMAHMVIGLILFAFVWLQVIFALARPSPKSNLRRYWAPTHHNVGRLALLLGFANAIIGAYAAHMDYDWYVWICVVWGVIVLFALGLIAYSRTRPVRPAADGKLPNGTATSAGPGARTTANDTPYI